MRKLWSAVVDWRVLCWSRVDLASLISVVAFSFVQQLPILKIIIINYKIKRMSAGQED